MVVSSSEADTEAMRLRHLLLSLRTNWLTAVIAHSGIGFLFAAIGHPLAGVVAFLVSAGFERFLTARTGALLHLAAGEPRRVWIELAVLTAIRSVIAATVLLALMVGQGFGGPFYPIALIGIFTCAFVVQLGVAPRIAAIASVPMVVALVLVGLRVQNTLPELGVWVTIATVVMTCLWLGIYSWQAQSRTMRLIAESRQAQRALRAILDQVEAEAKVRENLEREVGLGFYDVDTLTAHVRWSPGAFRVYGRPEAEQAPPLDEVAAQVADGRGEALALDFLRTVFKGKTAIQHYPIIGTDGERRHVRTIAVPISDETGRVVRLSGVVVDETEQARLAQAGQAVERRLKAALSAGLSVLWEHDFVSSESFCLGASRHFLGTDQVGNAVVELILSRVDDDDRTAMMAAAKAAAKTALPQTVEHKLRFGDGQTGWVRTVLEARFRTDGPGYAIMTGLTSDISEEVARRDALASALDGAQAASRAKSSFLANMSHEIRTPLHGILAVADLLAQSDLDPRQREMMGLIQASGTALSAVVNDVLDLARVESGRLEINWQPVDLGAVVRAATDLFQLKAAEKGIVLSVAVELAPDMQFSADPVRLGQIISNLVSNAVKFTRTGGVSVVVSSDRDPHSPHGPVPVRIAVSDTGPGIPGSRLAHLFNRFEQLDGSITREHGGSGLGLSIAQSLARHMGGDIVVESTPGEGTTFTVQLELARIVREPILPDEPVVEATQPEGGDSLRVLAADDHPTNREVLRLVLAPLGMQLTMCANGLEAVEACRAAPFDLILMDLQMPVMDGLTAIAAIRAEEVARGRPRTPIAAVTANAMSHHRAEAMAAGADCHIAKPFTPDQLLNGIKQLLELSADDAERPAPDPVSQTAV